MYTHDISCIPLQSIMICRLMERGIHPSILSTHLALTCSQTAVTLSDRGEALNCNCFALYCCSVLQRVAACRLVLRFVADFPVTLSARPSTTSVLQCLVAVCCAELQRLAYVRPKGRCSVLQCVAVRCNVLQCVAGLPEQSICADALDSKCVAV